MNRALKLLLTVFLATALVIPLPVMAASGDTTVYITETGKCYHCAGCSSLSKSCIPTTLQNAVNSGLRACSKCNPPALDAAAPAVPASSVEAAPAPTAKTSAVTSKNKSAKSSSSTNVTVSKDTKKKVQEALNDLGYDCGKADGVFGKKSKNALKQYQKDENLTVTGTIDDATLKKLGL